LQSACYTRADACDPAPSASAIFGRDNTRDNRRKSYSSRALCRHVLSRKVGPCSRRARPPEHDHEPCGQESGPAAAFSARSICAAGAGHTERISEKPRNARDHAHGGMLRPETFPARSSLRCVRIVDQARENPVRVGGPARDAHLDSWRRLMAAALRWRRAPHWQIRAPHAG
jgi:hypothetical protein